MRALDRKLWRDLAAAKGQAVAIALVVACGTASLVGSVSTYDTLRATQAGYYEANRFADLFARLERAPASLGRRIAEIPGVERVETRIVVDVTLSVPGLAEPAVGRLISIPAGEEPPLDVLHRRSGRLVERGRQDEVVANEAFADAHGLRPGDSITAILNGHRRRLTIVGVALSPEYVYQIRGGEIFPDEKRFGVFWMDRAALEAAFDLEGAFNDVVLRLAPGAAEEEVIARLDALLAPCGGLGAHGRRHQISNRYVTDEFKQLRGMALIIPSMFMAAAAFLLRMVVSRLVATEREQIALLKAFGYPDRRIALHYLAFVWIIAGAGAVLGVGLGALDGMRMTSSYRRLFRFPALDYQLSAWVVAVAAGVAMVAPTLGALGAVRRASRLRLAEAMRPEAPPVYRATLAERLGLQRLFSPSARMVLRSIERRPIRALLSALGIAFSAAILVLGAFFEDSVRAMIDSHFHAADRSDVAIAFEEPEPARARHEVERLPGVRLAEPYRAVAARLRFGHRSYLAAVTGYAPGARLRRPVDARHRPIPLPERGVVLTKRLAEILDVRPGDPLRVEVLEGARPIREVRVAGLADELVGVGAYMDIRALHHLLREGGTISGAYLAVDRARLDELYARLKALPAVGSVVIREAALDSFERTLADVLLFFTAMLVAFATVISIGMVYNAARIGLAERARELATLRVLGFTRREASALLLGELGVLVLAGIPLGFAIGYGLAALAARFLSSELYRLPVVVEPATYVFAGAVVLLAAAASALVVRRRVDRLDLVAVLKARE
jgi:putative ABC transport system permease protein